MRWPDIESEAEICQALASDMYKLEMDTHDKTKNSYIDDDFSRILAESTGKVIRMYMISHSRR